MNTLVNLLKNNSVLNKNKWTLVAISIVFFVGLYWYYKKSKENFGITVGIAMDQQVDFKSDDGKIDLDDGPSKNLIQSKILYNNIDLLDVNSEVVDQVEWGRLMTYINNLHNSNVKQAEDLRNVTVDQFTISDIESVEFNLYTSGACELSADYKKQYEAIINDNQYGNFNVTNKVYTATDYNSKNFLHFIKFNVIECELLNQTTNEAGYDDGKGAIITDDVKRKCTRAGVGYFEKKTLRPAEDPEETKNKLPLLEFKIKGKYYDAVNETQKDFTVTYYFNEYETQLGLTSGSTTDLKANMLDWMKRIDYIIGANEKVDEPNILDIFTNHKFPQ